MQSSCKVLTINYCTIISILDVVCIAIVHLGQKEEEEREAKAKVDTADGRQEMGDRKKHGVYLS